MKTYRLDGTRMRSVETAHGELAERLELPAHYGKNLDALWDCLTDMCGEIMIENADELVQSLGAYGQSLLSTFREAAEKNPHLRVTLCEAHEQLETGRD